MEDKFYKDEFEQFLQQQANNHRMYPTDGVWLGIYKKLHGDKRWPGLSFAAFAFLIATIAISVYFVPKPNIFEVDSSHNQNKNPTDKKTVGSLTTPLLNSVSGGFHASSKDLSVSQKNNTIGATKKANAADDQISDQSNQQETINPQRLDANNDLNASTRLVASGYTPDKKQAEKIITPGGIDLLEGATVVLPVDVLEESVSKNGSNENAVTTTLSKTKGIVQVERDDKNLADDFLKQHNDDISLYINKQQAAQKRKFSYTVYLAPSISYRKLKDENILNRTNTNITGPVALNYVADVNKVVRHKPGTGIEAGFAITYNLTNTLGIRSGLQLNIRQYNIEAYKTPYEAATIALMNNTRVDTINTFAVYSNSNGYVSANLVNRYYQLSVPIGLQWEVIGTKKVKFNVAATIQPTYVLNNNSYLLSSNFKNYTISNNMLRNWTLNSSLEAYLSFKVGEFNWQLGPQFRYQHLPTLISAYPIHEHLMDYGLKLGVSKIIK